MTVKATVEQGAAIECMKGGIVKTLIIEDDAEIVESVSLAFLIDWPEAQITSTHIGRRGIEAAKNEAPDIIILDLALPDVGGFEVLEQVRRFSKVPIIVLTAKAEETDICRALEYGADDYIVKPCGQNELLLRVRARIYRDMQLHLKSPISYGLFQFNPSTFELKIGENVTELSPVESHIIYRLIKDKGHVSTFSGLIGDVWGENFPGSEYSLGVHIRHLRARIEDVPDNPKFILTKPGEGYFLAQPR